MALFTNIEHNTLWKNAFIAIPKLAESIRCSNAIECIKILYEHGKMSDEDFQKSIMWILKSEGFTWKN